MKCSRCERVKYPYQNQILIVAPDTGDCYCLVHLMREISKARRLKWSRLRQRFLPIVQFFRDKGIKVDDIPEMDIGEVIAVHRHVLKPKR